MSLKTNKKNCNFIPQEKEKIRDINKDLQKENKERIDEEINLISSQTDDTEDELDEEEDDKRLEEG